MANCKHKHGAFAEVGRSSSRSNAVRLARVRSVIAFGLVFAGTGISVAQPLHAEGLSTTLVRADPATVAGLTADLLTAARWSPAEFTAEHVESLFGVRLGSSRLEGRDGLVVRSSTGPLYVSLSEQRSGYRNLVIDWGTAAGNPTELQMPAICIRNDEIADVLRRQGWSLDHVSTGAPLDHINALARTESEQYRRRGGDQRLQYSFTMIYRAQVGASQSHCVSQFILSIEPLAATTTLK